VFYYQKLKIYFENNVTNRYSVTTTRHCHIILCILFYFTGEGFTEYIRKNISIQHILHGNKLNFTYETQRGSPSTEFAVFLMDNHSIVSSDLYCIIMRESGGYSYHGGRNLNVRLFKCTSLQRNSHILLPGTTATRWCDNVHVSIFKFSSP
jgi:hypothetical protein